VSTKRQNPKIDLRGIVYRERDAWIAHCLELDIVAEGTSPDDAVQNVLDLRAFQIDTAIENGDLESIFRPAPAKFWTLFYSVLSRRKSFKPSRDRIGVFDARELVLGE
jgi:hypothetical protein